MKKLVISSLIVLMLLSISTEVAVTNESGKKYKKRLQARELRILLKESDEKPLVFENWMKNPGYFTMSLFRETRENKVLLSHWMYDPLYFHPAFCKMVLDSMLRIEPWMTDNEYFYHSVPDIDDEIIDFEDWMIDSYYFIILNS